MQQNVILVDAMFLGEFSNTSKISLIQNYSLYTELTKYIF